MNSDDAELVRAYKQLAFDRSAVHWARALHVVLARGGVTIRVVAGGGQVPIAHLSGGILR